MLFGGENIPKKKWFPEMEQLNKDTEIKLKRIKWEQKEFGILGKLSKRK